MVVFGRFGRGESGMHSDADNTLDTWGKLRASGHTRRNTPPASSQEGGRSGGHGFSLLTQRLL